MSKTIKSLQWHDNRCSVNWLWKDQNIMKSYKNPLRRVLLLKDKVSVAIIASEKDEGAENAAIYNADGSLRVRLKVPFDNPETYSFYDIYYVDENLNVVLWSRSEDYNQQCFLDPKSGKMSNFRKEK